MKYTEPGSYTLVYKAVDECGNESEQIREVIAEESQATVLFEGLFECSGDSDRITEEEFNRVYNAVQSDSVVHAEVWGGEQYDELIVDAVLPVFYYEPQSFDDLGVYKYEDASSADTTILFNTGIGDFGHIEYFSNYDENFYLRCSFADNYIKITVE